MYIEHLASLNVTQWSRSSGGVGFLSGVSDKGVKTIGVKDFNDYRYELSLFGRQFVAACLPDELQVKSEPA